MQSDLIPEFSEERFYLLISAANLSDLFNTTPVIKNRATKLQFGVRVSRDQQDFSNEFGITLPGNSQARIRLCVLRSLCSPLPF